MPDFGLICEGVTDHAVISNILIGYFGSENEPEIFREHPDPACEKRHGGWTLVIKYLKDRKYRQSFQFNKYLIIQIDADISEDPSFKVAKQNQTGPIDIDSLIDNIIARLQREIDPQDLATYGDRFIFAIGVEQLECWLLPLWHSNNKGSKTANCLKNLSEHPSVSQKLKTQKLPPISDSSKDYHSYQFISKGYRKKKILIEEGNRNPSLARFLRDLDHRSINL